MAIDIAGAVDFTYSHNKKWICVWKKLYMTSIGCTPTKHALQEWSLDAQSEVNCLKAVASECQRYHLGSAIPKT